MTWLIVSVAKVEDTYISAAYETLGTLAFLVVVLVATNTVIYNKRVIEITTLSDAISKVANGNFIYRIPIVPKETLSDV